MLWAAKPDNRPHLGGTKKDSLRTGSILAPRLVWSPVSDYGPERSSRAGKV